MKVLLINSAELKERGFIDPICDALIETGVETNVKEYKEISDDFDFNIYNAVIISASPKGDNVNFEDRLRSFNWVKTTKLPVLGICAGHQFIGVLFGGELIRDRESEDGILTVQIKEADPIFEECGGELKVEQHHNDSVTLPINFKLLADSQRCKVQAIRHKERPLYGLQWHVERSNPAINEPPRAYARGFNLIQAALGPHLLLPVSECTFE